MPIPPEARDAMSYIYPDGDYLAYIWYDRSYENYDVYTQQRAAQGGGRGAADDGRSRAGIAQLLGGSAVAGDQALEMLADEAASHAPGFAAGAFGSVDFWRALGQQESGGHWDTGDEEAPGLWSWGFFRIYAKWAPENYAERELAGALADGMTVLEPVPPADSPVWADVLKRPADQVAYAAIKARKASTALYRYFDSSDGQRLSAKASLTGQDMTDASVIAEVCNEIGRGRQYGPTMAFLRLWWVSSSFRGVAARCRDRSDAERRVRNVFRYLP